MRLVRLRTKNPNSFWILDNISLTPFEDTSPPFDLDTVYEGGKEFIERSARVTGRIEIIDASNTREDLIEISPSKEPWFELPGQTHLYMPRPVCVVMEEEVEEEQKETKEVASVVLSEPESKPIPKPLPKPKKEPIISAHDVTPENHKKALRLLSQKVGIIEKAITEMPKTSEVRAFIYACLCAEKARKKRKGVTKFLEERFLMIPPE